MASKKMDLENDDFDVLQGLSEEHAAAMNEGAGEQVLEKVVRTQRPQQALRSKLPVPTVRPYRQPQGAEARMVADLEQETRIEEAPKTVPDADEAPITGKSARNEESGLGQPDVVRQRAREVANHRKNQLEIVRRQNKQLRDALGTLSEVLKNPNVCDIWRNPDGQIFVNEYGVGQYPLEEEDYMDDEQVMTLIGVVASLSRTDADDKHPYVETMFPNGMARFTAIMPPYTNSGPLFAIRRPGDAVRTLDDYLADGSVTRAQVTAIRKGVRRRDNILIVGGTGSGKTTFANAVFAEIAEQANGPSTRFIVLEDTPELRCSAPNVVFLQTGPEMDMTSLLARCMRLSPTNISIGELRGKEAHVLIKAWNTGHSGGITTVHAPSARGALTRLESLIAESGNRSSRQEISDAVHMIIVIKKDGRERRTVTEIRRLTTPTADDYHLLEA